MERIYRKIFKFDIFTAKNVSWMLLYLISAVIAIIAYDKALITVDIGATGELAFVMENMDEFILVAFSIIYALLITVTPFLITWWIYVEYNNIFSSVPKLINNLPKSNRSKLKKVINITLAMAVIYCIITFSVYYYIDNGIDGYEIIEMLLLKMGGFISPVLTVFIVDMWSRESHIDKGAKSTWNIISLIASFISISLVGVLFIDPAPLVLWIFLFGGIIVKIVYLFRNIESIKID